MNTLVLAIVVLFKQQTCHIIQQQNDLYDLIYSYNLYKYA